MGDDRSVDKPALLVLEDGTCFEGRSSGAEGVAVGELVFNTSMSGYQEILSDPSYRGQLVMLTMPHIGNYGVNAVDMESEGIQAGGLIARDVCREPSNYRSQASVREWLRDEGVVAIEGVDTRAVTRRIRDKGVMMGVIVHGATSAEASTWLSYLREQPRYGAQDYAGEFGRRGVRRARLEDQGGAVSRRVYLEDYDEAQVDPQKAHVVVVDYGVKRSILAYLLERGLRVTVVPGSASAEQVDGLGPDGVLLSNGPGDPGELDDYLPLVKAVMDAYPTFGICLGHQLVARALGAETFKLPFGHRGPNQPVQDLASGRIAMTSQNHGYSVREDTLPGELEVTHVNLNDETIEGMRHRTLPVFTVQYHPEAGPGPHDAAEIFDRFEEFVRAKRRS